MFVVWQKSFHDKTHGRYFAVTLPEYTGKGQPTAKPRHSDFCHVIVFCHILWLFPWDILICIRLTVPNSKWRESWLSSHWLIRFTFIFGVCTKPNSLNLLNPSWQKCGMKSKHCPRWAWQRGREVHWIIHFIQRRTQSSTAIRHAPC